ncbi:MAG: DUF3341 domain-containing protein [Phycisphaera sp.]|nr:DUF3341 domain-containing protein [Phycisphaera sp.]
MTTATETQPVESAAVASDEAVDIHAPQFHGLLAEYAEVDDLMAAARKIRDAGFTRWECFTPCPIHGLDKAMGVQHTKLPFVSLAGGITGCALGLLLVFWTNAISPETLPIIGDTPYAVRGYDFFISGKPFFSLPANIPPIFELTILFSAFGAFFGMIAMNMLPRFHNPVFNSRRFAKASDDRFFIAVEAEDPVFDREKTAALLSETGAASVEELED